MAKIYHKTNKAKCKSSHCRNHGRCPECRDSRTYNDRKRRGLVSLRKWRATYGLDTLGA